MGTMLIVVKWGLLVLVVSILLFKTIEFTISYLKEKGYLQTWKWKR